MLDQDANGSRMVKHYRIRDLDNGGVYISPRQRFSDITGLIEHYKSLSAVLFYFYVFVPFLLSIFDCGLS